jgi:hypothetical protein
MAYLTVTRTSWHKGMPRRSARGRRVASCGTPLGRYWVISERTFQLNQRNGVRGSFCARCYAPGGRLIRTQLPNGYWSVSRPQPRLRGHTPATTSIKPTSFVPVTIRSCHKAGTTPHTQGRTSCGMSLLSCWLIPQRAFKTQRRHGWGRFCRTCFGLRRRPRQRHRQTVGSEGNVRTPVAATSPLLAGNALHDQTMAAPPNPRVQQPSP